MQSLQSHFQENFNQLNNTTHAQSLNANINTTNNNDNNNTNFIRNPQHYKQSINTSENSDIPTNNSNSNNYNHNNNNTLGNFYNNNNSYNNNSNVSFQTTNQAIQYISQYIFTQPSLFSNQQLLQAWHCVCNNIAYNSNNNDNNDIDTLVKSISNKNVVKSSSSNNFPNINNNNDQKSRTSMDVPVDEDDNRSSISTLQYSRIDYNNSNNDGNNYQQQQQQQDQQDKQTTPHYDPALQTWRGPRPDIRTIDVLPYKTTHNHSWSHNRLKHLWYIFRREFCDINALGHRSWAFLIIITVLWLSIVTPFEFAFYHRLDYNSSRSWIKWVDVTADILFIVDVFKSLFTGYDSDDFAAFNFKRNLIRYMSDGTLFFDLLSISSTPFSFYSITPFNAGWLLVRLARCYKLNLYIKHVFRNNIASTSYEITRLIKYICILLLVVHVIACGWIYIGYIQIFHSYECTWLSPSSSTCNGTGLLSGTYADVYLTGLLLAVGVVASDGYGISAPTTNIETGFVAAWQLFGQLYFAFLVAQIVSVLAVNDSIRALFRSKLRSVNALLKYRDIPSSLRDRVVDYYRYAFHQRKTYPFFQQDILNDLSISLKRSILSHINQPLLESVYLLQGCDIHFLRRMMSLMQAVILVPGDHLCLQGDLTTSVLWITSGVCEVYRNNELIGSLTEYQHLGELALLTDQTNLRQSTVTAVTHCDITVLHRDNIQLLYKDYPDQEAYIKKRAQMATINTIQS